MRESLIFKYLRSLTIFGYEGKTGDWKNYFSPELNEETDRWIKEQLGDSDLSFIDFIDE